MCVCVCMCVAACVGVCVCVCVCVWPYLRIKSDPIVCGYVVSECLQTTSQNKITSEFKLLSVKHIL